MVILYLEIVSQIIIIIPFKIIKKKTSRLTYEIKVTWYSNIVSLEPESGRSKQSLVTQSVTKTFCN